MKKLTFLAMIGLLGPFGALAADDGPLTLKIDQAMQMAVENNLQLKLAQAQSDEARARALQAASALLPQVLGTARQTRTFKENLAALGFPLPAGSNSLIGPFNTFDARVRLSQELLNMEAVGQARSALRLTKAAAAQQDLARQQVAAAAALVYLEALLAQKAREAAQAGVELAQTLKTQAQARQKAGAASGIDVARANTRAAEESLRLMQAQTAVRAANLRLKRVTGLPLGQSIETTDTLGLSTAPAPALADALNAALSGRAELRMAAESLRAADEALSAARWSRAPALSVEGDYGLSGITPSQEDRATGSVGVSLNMPLFTSGRVHGRVLEARSRRTEAQARLSDIQTAIEEDVRLAMDEEETSRLTVATAEQAVTLAEQELSMARNRYEAGAGDNVEVVAAQTALARVQDAYVEALAADNAARINLAMALGRMTEFRF